MVRSIDPRKAIVVVLWLFGPLLNLSGVRSGRSVAIILCIQAALTFIVLSGEPWMRRHGVLGSLVSAVVTLVLYVPAWFLLRPVPEPSPPPTAKEIAAEIVRGLPTPEPVPQVPTAPPTTAVVAPSHQARSGSVAVGTPSPLVEGLRVVQRARPSEHRDAPYAVLITVQTDRVLNSPTLIIRCENAVAYFEAMGGPALAMHTGQRLDHRTYRMTVMSPAFSPDGPIAIVASAAHAVGDCRVTKPY